MTGLPAWYGEAERRWIEKQRVLKAAADSMLLARPVADSPSNAPGWIDMGQEYSLGEDPLYPRDPTVTKAIQIFDPKIVPLWCRWGFLPPDRGDVVVFGRHAVGRWVDNPHGEKAGLPGLLSLVNQVEFIWEGTIFGQKDPRAIDLPGAFLPWDWRLYSFCREHFVANPDIKAMKQQFVQAPKAAKHKAAEERRADLAYRAKDLQKFVDKKLAEAGEVEIKRHFLGD